MSTATTLTRPPAHRLDDHGAPGSGSGSPVGRPAFAGICNQECRGKLREMARTADASARRAREAEASAGEQSRAFQDAKQRLLIASRTVDVERSGAERMRMTIAAHEVTIMAHEKTIATHEGALSTATVLAREGAIGERDRQQVALVEMEKCLVSSKESYIAAQADSQEAQALTVKAIMERDVAIAHAVTLQTEVGVARIAAEKEASALLRRSILNTSRKREQERAPIASDAAISTGHCLAVGIEIEAHVPDVAGEWEWTGGCPSSHECTQFYNEAEPTGVGGGEPTADPLVEAIIADLKVRMEVNIKARVPVVAGV